MKYILALLLSLAVVTTPNQTEAVKIEGNHPTFKHLRWELCQYTAEHLREKYSQKRDWNEYRIFMFSAYRVAEIFPMYPAKHNLDRMLQLFELGHFESNWKKDFAVANIPGAKYSNGKVKSFTVDFSWAGVNQRNVGWTYRVAKALQDGKPLPRRYTSSKFRKLVKNVKIPKSIKLRRINLVHVDHAQAKWEQMTRDGIDPNEIRKRLKITEYKERTQDDIDSALIYRVIVELDRMSRGWPYGAQSYDRDREIYNLLSFYVLK